MTVRQTRALKTKAKLVAAAEKLINEKGFDAVQIIDITREAGVGKGTFYTYFNKKEDVVGEIAHSKFEAVHDYSSAGNKDVCGRITAFLTGSMELIRDCGLRMAQQWVKEVVDPDDPDGVRKLEYDRRVIRGMLEKAAESGELKKKTPAEEIAGRITAHYYGIVFCWALTDGETDPVADIGDFCRDMLAGYLKQYQKSKK